MTVRRALASGVSAALVAASLLLFVPASASAAQAWVRGGIRLTLRTEAGTKFRIIGGVSTGDAVDILGRTEGWTRVRLPDGKTGCMPDTASPRTHITETSSG